VVLNRDIGYRCFQVHGIAIMQPPVHSY
jgi:hypothetical protein